MWEWATHFFLLSFLLGKKLKLFVSTGCVYSEWFPHNSGEGPLKTRGSRDNCYIRMGSYYIPNIKNQDSAAEVSETPKRIRTNHIFHFLKNKRSHIEVMALSLLSSLKMASKNTGCVRQLWGAQCKTVPLSCMLVYHRHKQQKGAKFKVSPNSSSSGCNERNQKGILHLKKGNVFAMDVYQTFATQ